MIRDVRCRILPKSDLRQEWVSDDNVPRVARWMVEGASLQIVRLSNRFHPVVEHAGCGVPHLIRVHCSVVGGIVGRLRGCHAWEIGLDILCN